MSEDKYDLFLYDNKGKIIYDFYSPENVIASDTDSAYLSLEKIFDRTSKKEEVIEFADSLGKEINKTFPKFMLDTFNCDEENCVIETDREKVCDVSLFLAKKNYILHVVNSEGVDVDDTDYTGVEIIKSNTPVIIQNFLMEMVKMIMSFKTFEEIQKFYLDFKDHYMRQPINVIGSPMQLKTFVKYEKIYEKTGSMDGFTRQAKAVLNYNNIASSNDKKIRAGDSIKLCYIKHKNLETIAFPAEDNDIPDFVYNFEIDYYTSWKKIITNIERYLIPMGWDRETRKLTRVNQILKLRNNKYGN